MLIGQIPIQGKRVGTLVYHNIEFGFHFLLEQANSAKEALLDEPKSTKTEKAPVKKRKTMEKAEASKEALQTYYDGYDPDQDAVYQILQ